MHFFFQAKECNAVTSWAQVFTSKCQFSPRYNKRLSSILWYLTFTDKTLHVYSVIHKFHQFHRFPHESKTNLHRCWIYLLHMWSESFMHHPVFTQTCGEKSISGIKSDAILQRSWRTQRAAGFGKSVQLRRKHPLMCECFIYSLFVAATASEHVSTALSCDHYISN